MHDLAVLNHDGPHLVASHTGPGLFLTDLGQGNLFLVFLDLQNSSPEKRQGTFPVLLLAFVVFCPYGNTGWNVLENDSGFSLVAMLTTRT